MKINTPIPAKGKASILRLSLSIFFVLLICIIQGNIPATADVTPTSSDPGTTTCNHCGVSDQEITKYLSEYGYVVYGHRPEPGTCNVLVVTQYPYLTRVIIENSSIIIAEDINH